MNLPIPTEQQPDAPQTLPATLASGKIATWLQPQQTPLPTTPNTDFAGAVRLGLWILFAGFGGFLLWALLAPLDEGIPAQGVVSVEGSRKRIDHPTGGIVEIIKVKEGQEVKAGDELLVLNETQTKSALNALLSQWYTATAVLARLRAERENATTIVFPTELKSAAAKDPEARGAIVAQENLLRSRRSALDGELRIIRESAKGLELQLESLTQLKRGREQQVALFREQLESYQKLKGQGFLSRNHLLEVERQLAEVQSKQSEDLSNIAGINTRLSEFRMRSAQREMEYRREVETLLSDAQREAATLGERLAGQRDAHNRLVLRAPVAGTVVDLAFHTIGGVVKPGDRIMDIVPRDDELIVEARIAPQYIDKLHAGLPADVHFDAYANQVLLPVITGNVAVVSADVLTDQRSGQPYYTIRVTVPGAETSKLGKLRLQPGMQATVMVKTGERSMMSYLMRPIMRRFVTAMRE
ncbi:MAG: HlyD family type I secretion periplasmic adaptor subunit [Rhodocyclaceae bacterium]|nr:HlyD family type I secretion periplasmic adaptor subunit [Rhodocyclaceae bacterium]MDZ4214464.1 HlyD family type I secretion periplasmic adaptor subunit [Rhodocyclaceae bacterium]